MREKTTLEIYFIVDLDFSGNEGEVVMELALRHRPVQLQAASICIIFQKSYIFESCIRWKQ